MAISGVIMTNLDTYKLNARSLGENIVSHDPNPALGKDQTEVWTRDAKRIGQGGFGSVWLEKERYTGALRAVKKIYLERSRNFPCSRELNALIKVLHHRDLFVQFFGWYEETDFIFVAMEYLENGDLEQYLKDFRLKAKSEAEEIATQLLGGLAVLHENSICHRDLKPSNILVARRSPIQIKLTDFGSSKSTVNTSLRTRCGTSGYMAPELLGIFPSKKRYTNALDIWSLGCVIYEILTSELPFLRKSADSEGSASSSISTRPDTSSVPDVDIGILMEFCRGETSLLDGALEAAGVSDVGINFLKGLLAANPASRILASKGLELRGTWFFEVREELNEARSPCILRQQFHSLGLELSDPAINELIMRCKMHQNVDITDFGIRSISEDQVNEAIKRGYNLIVELLIPLMKHQSICLHTTVECANLNIKTMISVLKVLDFNATNFSKEAFFLAAKSGYAAVVMLLLGWGVDVNSRAYYGKTALHSAAQSGHLEVVALLLDKGVDVNSKTGYSGTALHSAARSGHLEVVALLLDKGVDVNSKTYHGKTALHSAAQSGHLEVVALLLDKGVDVNSRIYNGETALHSAAQSGHLEVVALLLNKGVDVNSRIYSRTALHSAAQSGHLEVVALLLDKGVDVNSKTDYGKTALHSAAQSGHLEVVALLLDKGVDVSSETSYGGTALHLASQLGHSEVVALLRKRRMDSLVSHRPPPIKRQRIG